MPTPGMLGKLPVRHDPRTLRLRDYLSAALPPPPPTRTWDHGVRSWGVMANDRIGDCTCAAVGHAVQVATVNASTEVTIADADIIKAYSAVSGYDPRTGANDNGAVELDVLKYWQATGVGEHRNSAYAACSVSNADDVKDCINLFGFAYIGFAVPQSAMDQFGAGQAWDVVARDGGIVGGHAVICIDYDAAGLTCITWGSLQRMTWAFWTRYVDEAYGVVVPEWVAANGSSPSGLNLQQLLADVQQLQDQPQPTPQPVATTTTLAASPTSLNVGDSATLSASVTAADGSTPTGSVAFTAGGQRAGGGTAPTASASWTATGAGTVALTATYSGDSTHSASTGSASVTVYAAPVWKPNSTILADIVWLEDVADYCFERYGAGTDASAATDTAHWLAAMAQEITALLPFLTGAATGEPPRTPRVTPKLPGVSS